MIKWIVQKIIDARVGPQVLVVGIEGSGSRTFVQQLNPPGGGGIKSILTTLSYGCDIIDQDNALLSLTVYGGNQSMRWYDNFGTASIVCVVDSSDEAKIELTKVTLGRFFERYEKLLRKAVLLVMANKQDRLDALSVTEVKERLELETQFKGRRWHIQGTNAVSGLGIKEGLDWMARQI